MTTYSARWTTNAERRLYNGANGVVEADASIAVCHAPSLATAQRIAHCLNLGSKFSLDELERVSNALCTA